jgi:hypothetical protein
MSAAKAYEQAIVDARLVIRELRLGLLAQAHAHAVEAVEAARAADARQRAIAAQIRGLDATAIMREASGTRDAGTLAQAVADHYRSAVDRRDPLRCERGEFRDADLSSAWATVVRCASGLPVEGFAEDPLATEAAEQARNHVARIAIARAASLSAASAHLAGTNAEAVARYEAAQAAERARVERISKAHRELEERPAAPVPRADGTI